MFSLDYPPFFVSAWTYLLNNLTDFQFRTLGTFVLHEVFYWGSYVPFFVMDQIPSLRKYKIQPEKDNTVSDHIHCAANVIINHFFIVLPTVVLSHQAEIFGVDGKLPLPSLWEVFYQVILCFVIEDYIFYWGHRALHTPYLYKKIHSVHHKYSAPLGIAAEYAHPLEVIFLGVATIFGPLLLRPHLFTLWVYLFFRCFQTVECHSGYDFPWSLSRWLPGYGGADFHDHHHKNYSGNYASVFKWVDYVHGTDLAYKQWKAKQELNTNTNTHHLMIHQDDTCASLCSSAECKPRRKDL